MYVAEIHITTAGFMNNGVTHVVRFSDAGLALKEYARIADLIDKRGNKSNDLPKTIEVMGDGNKMSLPVDEIRSVGMSDFVRANEEQAGVADAFPNLFKR